MVSSLLVGLVMVGAMRSVGATLHSRGSSSDTARAEQLAQQLLTEILNGTYLDTGTPLFGPETGEPTTNVGPRSSYDDVDDYHQWSKTPPQDRSGVDLPNLTGWQRDVTVEWVDPASPSTVSGTELGTKRIIVSVQKDGVVLATQVSLRTDKYQP